MVDAIAVFQAFAAGVLSFFAPCSIAMLPAYISYYLGRDLAAPAAGAAAEPAARLPLQRKVAFAIAALIGGGFVILGMVDVLAVGSGMALLSERQFLLVGAGTGVLLAAGLFLLPGPALRGARIGAITSLGILAVFGLLGLPVYGILRAIDFTTQSIFVLAVAGAMMAMGALGLAGRDLSVVLPIRAPKGRETASFALFGVGYGIVAMGCNLPLFLLAALGPIVRAADAVTGVAALLAYGAGMALLLIALTVSLALSRGLTQERLRTLVPRIKTLGNVVLIGAGLYIVYYDLTVLRLAG